MTDQTTLFLEWEEQMHSYFTRQSYTGLECVDEVVNRLMGRARDNTKVWLCSNPEVTDMNVIFSVLR